MNDKESNFYRIVKMVVDCCSTNIDGTDNITPDDIFSKNRMENVVLTRQIVVMELLSFGYTKTTIAQILHCTQTNVRKMLHDGYNNLSTSKAFRLAYAEATLRCKDIV